MKAQDEHIGAVRQFRTAQTRMNHMSEDASKAGRRDNADEFIKVDLDACDEAKFKCPRNVSNSKSLEKLWRPQLHLHGSLVWGVSWPIVFHIKGFVCRCLLMFARNSLWIVCVVSGTVVLIVCFRHGCPWSIFDIQVKMTTHFALQVAECFYVLDPDIAKDASTEATILAKSLDDANEILRQRSTSMPGNLILEAWSSLKTFV